MALISYSKKFIFVHIYKCAGSSMNSVLSPYCEPKRTDKALAKIGFRNKKFRFDSLVPKHPMAKEIRNQLPRKTYDKFFKFAFVRNPWDMEVSLYSYMLQNPKHRQHNLIKSLNSFDDYIEWRVTQDLHCQYRYILDDDGNQIVDYIGKFENLEDDFDNICQRISISAKLPHVNKSNRAKYTEFYTPRSKKIVEKSFEKDIEIFKYSF
ncbi:sulfotransferase family 2 domain-containing protein [Nodosilinea sp. LEGE 07088]|uniref:sulfotransferase family 2 domain-containing protein n=1 Tax=Nodosilinea sp. LEGE 07088 TaxID=2777968 RepID=UPI00187E81AA|nr:sulfotransferase family 2 domain-containing protein [Nodosilinea sp. LEGE 07088]MBE9139435.1 sulfotransferase family 2 domain-containing protein [Nodosilinea sp. LEGE 07088]